MLRTKFAKAVAVGALIGGVGLVTVASNPVGAGQVKVDVCHADGQGNLDLINVAEPAYLPHLDHGDPAIGSSAGAGLVYGADCGIEVLPSNLATSTAASCNQPASDTWSYSTAATVDAGWSAVVSGGAGTTSVDNQFANYSGNVTLTDPLGAVTVQPFDGISVRPAGCEAAPDPAFIARFISTTSFLVPGGWAFESQFVVNEFPGNAGGYTWTSVPDGIPQGAISTGAVRTYTSGTLLCFIPGGVGHVVNWTASEGTTGQLSTNISKPAGC